ncbi:MAG: FecR domain-containing protein, partial [Planctomycetes bacterium]|nr:FecR domain-containing protein [Planctomycetota bacterium]
MDEGDPRCPGPERLAALLGGGDPSEHGRAELEAHWTVCEACRTAAADLAEAVGEVEEGDALDARAVGRVLALVGTSAAPDRTAPGGTAGGGTAWRPSRAVAAALLLAAGGGILVAGGALRWGGGVSPVLHGVLDAPGGGGVLVAGRSLEFSSGGTLRLDDGTEVVALENAGISLEAPEGPARLVLALEHGAVRVSVPPGRGEVHVRAADGLVRVTGTVFEVRWHGDPLGTASRILEVEVFRGSVEIVHGGQGCPVEAQVRGDLAPDGRCVRQGVVQAPGQGLPALLA